MATMKRRMRIWIPDLKSGFMDITHAKHPSTIWAGKTRANFDWLLEHALALCQGIYSKVWKVPQERRNTVSVRRFEGLHSRRFFDRSAEVYGS